MLIRKFEFLRFLGVIQVFYIHFMTIFESRSQFTTWGGDNSSLPINQGYTGFIILLFLSAYLNGLKKINFHLNSIFLLIKKIIKLVYKRYLRLLPGFLTATFLCLIFSHFEFNDLNINDFLFFLPKPFSNHILGVTWTIPYDFLGFIIMIFLRIQIKDLLGKIKIFNKKPLSVFYVWIISLLIILVFIPKLVFVYPLGYTLGLILESNNISKIKFIDKLTLNLIFIFSCIIFYYFNIFPVDKYGYQGAILISSLFLSITSIINSPIKKDYGTIDKIFNISHKGQWLFILLHYPTILFIVKLKISNQLNLIVLFIFSFIITALVSITAYFSLEKLLLKMTKKLLYDF